MMISAAPLTTLLLLVATAAASIAAYRQPIHVKAEHCPLDDSDCLKKYLQEEIIGKFSVGFPESGVKPLDPLHYSDLTFVYDTGIGMKAVVTHEDPILYGLAKTQVLDLATKVSSSQFSLNARISIPKLFYEGSYTFKGSWMRFPVNWKGKFNMTLGDINDSWNLTATIVQKGNGNYLDLQDLSLGPDVSCFNTYASGLFGSMEEVGNLVLSVTNKFWKHFFGVMWDLAKPEVTKRVSEEMSSIFSKTPVTVLTYV